MEYVQTSNFSGPTRNSMKTLLENLWMPQYQIEEHPGIFQNQTALYLVALQGNNHLKMYDFLDHADI